MAQRLLAAILVAALATRAQGTTANFNALVAGTSYPPGSLFSNGGLDFDVLFGLGNLNVAAASSPVNPSFTGNYVCLSSNVVLNMNLPTGGSQIQFDFILNDPAVALAINGGFLNYNQIPATINGVSVTKQLGAGTKPWGSITATGTISTFEIIGTTFWIDNLNATLLPGLPGDYNKNNFVDAADFAVFRKSINTPSGYRSWRANFGAPGSGSGNVTRLESGAVPEPSTLATMVVLLLCLAIIRGQQRTVI